MNDITRVTTGEVRLSYVHLFKPYAFQAGQEEKYSVTLLIPKTDTATKARLGAAIEAAKQRGITDKWSGVCPPMLPIPLHDGDGVKADGTEYGPECKGCWVLTASAKADYPPEVVDASLNPIINQSEVYSGMYGRVNVSFFPYFSAGKKGIGCGLGPVQKTRDGEALGGSAPTAAQAFGDPYQQPATPSFGAAQPATPGAAGYSPAQGYGSFAGAVAATGVNPITGLPL